MEKRHNLPDYPLSAIFQFSPDGAVKRIFLNCPTDRDQLILEKSLNRLIKPSHLDRVRRLFDE